MEVRRSNHWLFDRWSCLAAAMVMEACGGLGYTFAVYSQHIKERMNYDQEDLDNLGAAKDFGYSLGIIGGILYNFVPPWMTIVIGASMHFFGYSMVWMTTSGRIEPPGWVLGGFIAVGVGGDSWIDAAAIMTSLQNFDKFRGTAMGVLKAQVGLSGAIFVTLYKAFLKPNVDGYILLVAVAPAVASISVSAFVWPHPCDDEMDAKDENIGKRFKLAYGATIFLGLYLLTSVLVQAYEDLSRRWLVFYALTMLVNLALIWSLLVTYKPLCKLRDWWSSGGSLAIPAQEMMHFPKIKRKSSEVGDMENDQQPLRDREPDSQNYIEHSGDSEVFATSSGLVHKKGYIAVQPLSETDTHGHVPTNGYQPIETSPEPDTSGIVSKKGYHPIEMIPEPDTSVVKELAVGDFQEEIEERAEIQRQSLWQNLQQLNFWCLCLVAVLGPGSGLAVINNFGQIGKALGSESVELFVGLISIASCFGRLAAGYGSDVMVRTRGYPRSLCLSIAHLTMSVGCLILAVGYIPLLYVGCFLVGGAYGAFWSLVPAIISEVFGLQNFAALYKIIGSCSPVGAYILSAQVVGIMYDAEAEEYLRKHPEQQQAVRDEDFDGLNLCMGRGCFGTSMIVLACVCVVGSCIGALLAKRTWKLYARTKVTSPSL